MQLLIFISCFFCVIHSLYGSYDFLAPYQGHVSEEKIRTRIETYLQKDASLSEFYSLTSTEFSLFANAEEKAKKNPEFTLQLAPSPQEERLWPSRHSLEGVRIALDPGHFGGALAFIERRYFDQVQEGKLHYYDEGTLAWETALHLKMRLEDAGATVFLSRKHLGQGALESSFGSWLDAYLLEQSQELHSSTTAKQEVVNNHLLFKLPLAKFFQESYNKEDLLQRAQAINAFAPDLTLLLHYNSSGLYDHTTGFTIGTDVNYSLVFIPGAFLKGELNDPQARVEFARLAITPNIERSLLLSEGVEQHFIKNLGVPAAPRSFMQGSCMHVAEGVFCRNLSLTRLIRSPLCYGEPLIQDCKAEMGILSEGTEESPSPRVVQVADAYFQALLELFTHVH